MSRICRASDRRGKIMSVRKRIWRTSKGCRKEAWVVDYVDQFGGRHIETFERKKDADDFRASVNVDVRQGVHTPQSKSITVAEAAADWIAYVKLEGREHSTVGQYRQHVDLHIDPRIGREKLANLTTPLINKFRDELLTDLSRAMAKKVLASLKSLLRDAKRRGNVAQNVALDVKIGTDKRDKRKVEAGIDFPTLDEIKQIIGAAAGMERPLLLTAIFTGLRSSELRGLRWMDVDLKASRIHVRQRVDRRNVIGKPKSASGNRTIPIGPQILSVLREWKLACPKGPQGLVFPNGRGNFENHGNIVKRVLCPVQVSAGVTVPVLDAGGKQKRDTDGTLIIEAKYPGTHALRHFYASWCINRKADGGLELPPKIVQYRLGHSSIMMTMDVYGHLFPSDDDGAELVAAEKALMV
jgi:integrase